MKKHICFLLITALLCSSLSGCVSTAVGDDDFVPKGGEMLMKARSRRICPSRTRNCNP